MFVVLFSFPLVFPVLTVFWQKNFLETVRSGLRIHLKGVVISDYSYEPSHYSCIRSLGEWLSSQGIPGIYGVDTRAITKLIRSSGSILGKLVGSNPSLALEDPNMRNLVAEVSRKEKEVFVPPNDSDKRLVHILAVDCGMKNNIIRLGRVFFEF